MTSNYTDPSQNYIERYPQPLDAIFTPKNVAVIGAKDTEGSVGKTILANLIEGGFAGQIYPINPKRESVLGFKCYSTIELIPDIIDLAIIVTPAITVPDIMLQCVQAGVKGVIVISAGFKELGEEGIQREQQVVSYAQYAKIPLIGPNCLGVMNPIYGLNATFAKGMALKGNIAFISQSGAMLTSVLDWSFKEQIGFSSIVSVGSMADVDWGQLIDYLGSDPNTHSILIYMESIGNPRSFLSAAKEIAPQKPIIIIKAGRSTAAAKAAASHTGSLAGSDHVFDAALERVGVLRVNAISELFSLASALALQPKPEGPNLAIVTNAGGPAVLATDAAVLNGAQLAVLDEQMIEKLDTFLPKAWSHGNPVDLLGDAGPERYAKTIEALSTDPSIHGMLAILTPQDMTDPLKTAKCLDAYAKVKDKPLLASWMGGDSVIEGVRALVHAGIPCYEYPDDAAKTFAIMWRYYENLKLQYKTQKPNETVLLGSIEREKAHEIIQKSLRENRTLLDEFDSKRILACYGIDTVETHIAKNKEKAVEYAEKIGFPVVLKLFSKSITHKTDVGGVKLNLVTSEQVKKSYDEIYDSVVEKSGAEHFDGVTVQKMITMEGYEVIFGSSVDPQFGPVMMFGHGGQLVEIFNDVALAIPPLNTHLARQLMEKTTVYKMLLGVRGREPVNLNKLEQLMIRFSLLIVENPWIKECDVNPLLISPEGMIALDSRIVLHDPGTKPENLPKLAIRPYPYEYEMEWMLKNQIPVTIRPIIPEDEPLVVDFHKRLSEDSVRQRYFEFMSLDERTSSERIARICTVDYDREIVLVAVVRDDHQKKIAGIARLSRVPGINQANMKLTIADDCHDLGLGTKLISCLIDIARKERIEKIVAHILVENHVMIHICKKLGFACKQMPDKPIIVAEL